MRTTKELLKLMLENIHLLRYGLCGLAHKLHVNCVYSFEEYQRLCNLIRDNRPERTYDDEWYWKPSLKKPRVNWINKQIGKITD